MAIAPAQQPDDNASSAGSKVSGTNAPNAFSGTRPRNADPTNLDGQYPPGGWASSIFGGTLPTGTGAPGSAGQSPGQPGTDPSNEPGQTDDGFAGLPQSDIVDTGAPGTATDAPKAGGATAVSYTAPGSPYSGTYQSETQQEDLQGPNDSTQANTQGYATGGPQLPGIQGNEPQAGNSAFQPASGDGHVLRGGRSVRP